MEAEKLVVKKRTLEDRHLREGCVQKDLFRVWYMEVRMRLNVLS